MVSAGWASLFLVYPSLPQDDGLNILVNEARTAWTSQRGAWDEFGTDLLLGYEYRLCVKLAADDTEKAVKDAFQRGCIDLRTLTDVGLHGWAEVPPAERLWYWMSDADQARRDITT